MTTPIEFEDIRPYNAEEIPQVVGELAQDPLFKEAVSKVFPIPFEEIIAKALQCKSLLEIQKTFIYAFLKDILNRLSEGIDMQADCLDKSGNYTFVSNHRDIVLDAALLSEMMVDNGFDKTAELCAGDNLLATPWIKKAVRLCKGIVVKRGLGFREQLTCSKTLSNYIHYVITEKKDNVWIAQREGRAKDSNDFTQESILKMLSMGGGKNVRENLKELNIVPLTISYEFDPCDFLSMNTGIFGYKGHIHYQTGSSISKWIDELPQDIQKNDFFVAVTRHIDHVIHSNYRLYANNYIASDMLKEESRFASLYNDTEKKRFEDYLQKQVSRINIPDADHTFLIRKMLEMYANPLYNYLKAAEQEH